MRALPPVTIGLLAASAALCATPRAALVLTGRGFAVDGRAAAFGRTRRTEAIALVARALGPVVKRGSYGDCGHGDVIGYARFRDGFELSFVKGRLSGWTADGASPRTREGAAVGVTLATLRRLYPHIYVDPGDEANGGVGPSFQQEDGPNGWLSGTKPGSTIAGLFAGATCLPGV